MEILLESQSISFSSPHLNAAGSLGFYPDLHAPVDISDLGAFITNPISRQPRTPARPPRMAENPGSFLLHTGFPNPGLSQVIKRYAAHWARFSQPVIVHLLADNYEDMEIMVQRIEMLENVSAVEIGLPNHLQLAEAISLAQAALGELPVIVRAPLFSAVQLAPSLMEIGATAISLGPPRGMSSKVGQKNGISGRMFGPSVFPIALQVVEEIARMGIPLIGGCGVYSLDQAKAMLDLGAIAVQWDSALWRGDKFLRNND